MNNKNSKKIYRRFGILIGITFPLIIGFIIPYIFGHNFRNWTLFIGLPLLLLALFKPELLKNIYRFWFWIGNLLGLINSRILLGCIFFLILMPISLIMKSLGYDPLKRKKINKGTYLVKRKDDNINLEKIF